MNSSASVSVLKDGQELADSDTVEAGMTVCITAENGDVNELTVAQKNIYNWTADYMGPPWKRWNSGQHLVRSEEGKKRGYMGEYY